MGYSLDDRVGVPSVIITAMRYSYEVQSHLDADVRVGVLRGALQLGPQDGDEGQHVRRVLPGPVGFGARFARARARLIAIPQ
jgi:hypothetical protein